MILLRVGTVVEISAGSPHHRHGLVPFRSGEHLFLSGNRSAGKSQTER
jgi:hypothetical protein